MGKRKSGAMDDFLALLVGDVLLFCLPHSCRKSPSGLRSPEKFCNYDDELSQHAFKCAYLSPVLSYSDLPVLFSSLCLLSVLLYTQILSFQYYDWLHQNSMCSEAFLASSQCPPGPPLLEGTVQVSGGSQQASVRLVGFIQIEFLKC